MVITNTNCSACVHFNVCKIREEVTEIKNKAMSEFDGADPNVDITVSCKEYYKNSGIRSPLSK